jgi:DNA-binding transcriptional MerR regulator
MMKPGDLADWLGVSVSTVRAWSSPKDFGDYLSSNAGVGDGRMRNYDERDQRIVAYISDMRRRGFSRDDMVIELNTLRANDWRDLPRMPPKADGQTPSPRTGMSGVEEQSLAIRMSTAMLQIETLNQRINDLETRREQDRDKIASLSEEIGRLRMLVELYRTGKLKSD